MLTKRQQQIFKLIVEEFVQCAEPVGSKTLMEKYSLPYSSATIRNEMNALETEGLLEKTHTSSGRVPSAEGYRYYAEYLMDLEVEESQKQQLVSLFSSNLDMEDIIRSTCDMVSHMTNLTSVVLGPDASKQSLAHIRLFPLDDNNAVAVFITDQGHTENKTFHFEEGVSVEDIQNCTAILNDRLKGTPICEVANKMGELRPVLANAVKRYEILFNAFMQAFVRFASEQYHFSGAANMLYQPEFADVEKMTQLVRRLEDSNVWRNIGSGENTLTLKLPSSQEVVWVDDMAVVSTPLKMKGGDQGQIMIVGPSRMNYKNVAGILNFVASVIENRYRSK
ncbi:MAG: heat-inducible transcription repressor HrcA [Erysipelotrichaceae bacterium]|nr:heat-inducible transcription repressor HrcA [Erysipelotrichaceae bacterium]